MKLGHSLVTWKWIPPPSLPATIYRRHVTSDSNSYKVAESVQSETLKILEWPSVCSQLSAFTSTSMGLSVAKSASVPLGRTKEESKRLLDQTSAALAVSRKLDFSGIYDVSRVVEDTVSGKMLSIGDLCLVKGTLRSARSLVQQLEHVSLDDRCYALLEILKECDFLVELEQKLEFCLDCKFSVVLDRASEDLEMIRSERKRNMENLEQMLKQISSRIFQSGGSDRPLVTRRRSRMCVAIKTTHKSLLPGGVILDSSSSGATYYMEPREAVDLNNLEVRLSNSEKIEEQAILSLLSAEIAESSAQIKYLLDRVLELDLAFARAAHAQWINGVCPFFSSGNNSFSVDVDSIQHPLLLESSLSQRSDVSTNTSSPVPIDFKIRDGVKVVVISGPNTGGKTASMKTLGLVSIMSKAGMYIPARNNPQLPWFDLVLADIGDQQSLEQSLSTFSGHISRIRKILEVTSEKSLVLLDEIGSGTDPSEGVALSASILQYLKERVNLAVVTTHYADLTRLKEEDARFENAAMEFSLESLEPTYKILWGSMGESNALSIANTIGFDGKIIERAQYWVKKLTPGKMQKFNSSLYQSLSEERGKLEIQAERATSLHSDILQLYNEIAEEAGNLDVREPALKANETQRIQEELKNVKSKIDHIVQEFESQLRTTSSDKFSTLLKKTESDIALIIQAHQPSTDAAGEKVASNLYVPNIGEQVVIKGFGSKLATVIEAPADDNTVLVRLGKITVRVHLSSLNSLADGNETTSSRPKRQDQITKRLKNLKSLSDIGRNVEVTYGPAVQTSKNSVDLRGMRVEEAILHVNTAINSRGSRSVLFVIHGMGTGVLKERVHELLRNHPRIDKFEQESPLNYGCTVAYIK